MISSDAMKLFPKYKTHPNCMVPDMCEFPTKPWFLGGVEFGDKGLIFTWYYIYMYIYIPGTHMMPLSSFGWLTFKILWVNTLKTRVMWVSGICIMNNSWNFEKKTSNDSPTPHLPDPPLDAKIFKGLASVGRTDRIGSKPSMVRSGSGWWLNDSDGENIISWISWPINMLPSGKLTVCELENCHRNILIYPVKMVIFHSYVNVYQRRTISKKFGWSILTEEIWKFQRTKDNPGCFIGEYNLRIR